jgi:hypothetical protein
MQSFKGLSGELMSRGKYVISKKCALKIISSSCVFGMSHLRDEDTLFEWLSKQFGPNGEELTRDFAILVLKDCDTTQFRNLTTRLFSLGCPTSDAKLIVIGTGVNIMFDPFGDVNAKFQLGLQIRPYKREELLVIVKSCFPRALSDVLITAKALEFWSHRAINLYCGNIQKCKCVSFIFSFFLSDSVSASNEISDGLY